MRWKAGGKPMPVHTTTILRTLAVVTASVRLLFSVVLQAAAARAREAKHGTALSRRRQLEMRAYPFC